MTVEFHISKLFMVLYYVLTCESIQTVELEQLRPNTTVMPFSTTSMPTMMTTLPACGYVEVINCTMLDEYHSLWAMKNTNATVTFTTNLMTLAPFNATGLANNDTYSLLTSARFNASGN